ncbi:MAG: transcriptional repressor LexA [Hamadaea sp.]|nr:transcriptional repressor LexA [Hamadaea sp.]
MATSEDGSVLTDRQRRIVAVIHASVEERGYPPTMREIAAAVGLSSASSVAHHLKALERLGVVRREAHWPRAVDARPARVLRPGVRVPILGTITAGHPILAHEDQDDELTLPPALIGHGPHFALRVRGDSMIDAAICDGDVVVVRRQQAADHGDIVAAMNNGEATVKVYRARDGHVELVPRNARYDVIPGDDAVILGKVVAVLRRL